MTSETQRPSALRAFFSGGKSGLISGVVMATIIAGIAAFPLLIGTGAGAALATFGSTLVGHSGVFLMLASTLFGGVMAAGRTVFGAPNHSHTSRSVGIVPVPVPGVSGPTMAPVMTYADAAPEQVSTKNWVADTGRSEGGNNRIQQILSDGALSDKDRASALLASREIADKQASRA